MYEHILVPLDGSPLAEQALSHAQQLATQFNSSVTLVRVIHAPSHHFVQMGAKNDVGEMMETFESTKVEAESYLKEVVARLETEGIKADQQVTSSELIAEHIVTTAAGVSADAIVMATHGRYGFDRLINGSIAEEVVRLAEIPVILVSSEQ